MAPVIPYEYIPESGLANLARYKYHGSDNSLIGRFVLQPFWNKAVTWLPTWMAPNLVTLTGFIPVFLCYLLTAYFCPTLNEPMPSWMYLVCCVTVFFYQTMDAIDGKQARRTGTSSPLGELFDHGCDALTTIFISLTTLSVMRIGNTTPVFFAIASVLVPFFLTQWEEYFTGSLNLGYVSVTEAQCAMMGIDLTSFFLGSDWWLQSITIFGIEMRYNWLVIGGVIGSGVFTSLTNFFEAGKAWSKGSGNVVKGVQYLTPMIVSLASCYVWIKYSPLELVVNFPHSFNVILGFVTANLVGRIIVARVCGLPGSTFPLILIPLVLSSAHAFFLKSSLVSDAYVVYFNLAWFSLTYLHFALGIIEEMCKHLKIRCLRIPYPNQATQAAQNKSK